MFTLHLICLTIKLAAITIYKSFLIGYLDITKINWKKDLCTTKKRWFLIYPWWYLAMHKDSFGYLHPYLEMSDFFCLPLSIMEVNGILFAVLTALKNFNKKFSSSISSLKLLWIIHRSHCQQSLQVYFIENVKCSWCIFMPPCWP